MADPTPEPEIVAQVRTLHADVERLTKARDQVREFANAFDGFIQILKCLPVVALRPDEWYERGSPELDIDPDEGVRLLRQVRAMFDNLTGTYDRKLNELHDAAWERLNSATEEEYEAYRQHRHSIGGGAVLDEVFGITTEG